MSNTLSQVKQLQQAGHKNTKLVGGKAASLGEMIKAGVPVPDGFVVTTEVFKQGMTPQAQKEILQSFNNLGAARVAVRSSAVAEDSAEASWAGQLESYLNVTKDGLISAIKKCWGSIESTRAKHYAEKHKISGDNRAVAVVVQAMVNSDISGVMFTAHPVSGNRGEIMIEAIYGLGEMIVQGIVTPESVVIDKKTQTVTSRSQHRQTKKLVFKNGENTEISLDPELNHKNILTDSHIKKLAALAKHIENHYNFPQDIEWAFAEGRFYIVQSRPITTLFAHQANQPLAESKINFLDSANDIFRWGPIRGHYFYISDFVTAAIETLPGIYKNERFPEGILLFNNEQMVWLSDQDKFIKSGKRAFKKYIEQPSTLANMKQNWDQAVAELTKFQISIIPERIKNLSDEKFIELWQKFYQKIVAFWVPTLLPELGNYGAPDLLKEDLKKNIHDEEELIRAQQILTAPQELSFYQEEEFQLVETIDLTAHHAKYFWLKNSYGHVEVLDQSFFKNRQSELITMPRPLSQSELEQKVKKAKQDLQAQYNLPDNIINRAGLISENIVWQDKRKRIMSENFHYKKILLEELTRRTHKEVEGLMRYGFDEVEALLSGKELQNVEPCHGIHFHTEVTRISLLEAKRCWKEYAHHKTQDINSITGIVASTGKKSFVKGRVRVLHSSHDILKPGEILVTAMTSPGYVFAMRHAAAVVTDIGGLTSHAAIVAREISVPCIVGTKVATHVLKTGDEVKIDVLRGIIKLIKEE